MTGEAFDLVSAPDAASSELRDALAGLAGGEGPLRERAGEALDLVTSLLLVRRAFIVVLQATGMEAVALPYEGLVAAALVPLRVRHAPEALPGVLQFLLPGHGAVAGEGVPTPGAGWDSEGESEAGRLRGGLEGVRRALLQSQGRDTVLALVEATLRT